MKKTYDVTGMSCSACSAAIERGVRKLDGVEQGDVNLLANKMTVSFDENQLTSDKILQAVEQAGYTPRSTAHPRRLPKRQPRKIRWRSRSKR